MNPGKYVIFALGPEQFGLPIDNVEQILKSSKITKIPKSSKDILGLFSLRGSTMPIVDTSNILGVPSEEKGYFLVVSIDGLRAALLVDQVHKIVDLTADQIRPTEDLAGAKLSSHCAETETGLVVLLTPEACLPAKALKKLGESKPNKELVAA